MSEDMQVTVKVAMESQSFQQQVNNINRQMKVVQTEFQNASSKLGDFGRSTEVIKGKAEALSKQLDLQKQKVTMFADAHKKAEETLQKNAKANEELKIKVEQTRKAYEDSVKATGKNSEETKKLKTELDKLSKEYTNNQNTINNNVRTIDNYNIKLNQAEKEVNELGKEIKKTNMELTNFKFTQFSEKMGAMSGKFKKVGEGFKTVGDGILKKVVAPLATAGAACGKFYIDFDDSMTKVRTIADTGQVSIEGLSKGVLKLSNNTGKSAEELGNALYETISAGAETKDALGVLEVATKNAKAGFAETTTSVDVLTTTMNSYKLKSEDLMKVSDQLIVAQNFGKTTVAEMGQSMGNVIPIASQMNVGTKELFASIATLTRNGIHTSESITGMKAALSNIIKPSEDATKMAEALGLQFNASHLKSVGFAKFLEEVKEKTGGNTAAMAKLFGSVEALNSMMVLTGKGSSDFTEALKQMDTCAGLTDETFKKVNESSGEKFRNSLNKAKNSAIQLGASMVPIMDKISLVVEKVANKLNGMSEGQINLIIQFTKFAAIIGVALSGLGRFLIFTSNVTKAISILSKTQAFMTITTKLAAVAQTALNFALTANPIGIVIMAIAGLAAGLVYLYRNCEAFRNIVNLLGSKLKQFAQNIPRYFDNLPQTMINIGKFILMGLLNGMLGGIPLIIKGVVSIGNLIKNGFKKVMGIHSPSKVMHEYGKYIDEGLVEGMEDGEDDIIEQTKAIADGIKQTLDRNLDKINKFGEAITKALKEKYSKMQEIEEKALEKQIETEEKANEEKIKNTEKEYDNKIKLAEKALNELEKTIEKEKNAVEKAHDEKIKLYEDEYNQKLKYLDEETYEKIKALESNIDSIDKQTENEEKALKEQEYNNKIVELNKNIATTKSIQEREKLQKDLNKNIADHEREILLEQRKQQKENIKEEIENIKKISEKKKEEYKKELDEKKKLEDEKKKETVEKLQEQLKAEKEKVKEQKDIWNEELKTFKETEKEKLKEKLDILKEEKEKVKEHYEELKKEENLQAETRKLILDKNNTEIIELLNTYNSKWMDAGQSFAESLTSGLNSEKQTMQDVVKDMINVEPVVEEQIMSLQKLEAQLDQLKADKKAKGKKGKKDDEEIAGIVSEINGSSEIADLGNIADVTADKIEGLDKAEQNLNTTTVKTEETTKQAKEGMEKAVDEYVNKNLNMVKSLNGVYLEVGGISETMKNKVVGEYNNLVTGSNAKIEEHKNKTLTSMKELLEGNKMMSEEDKNNALQNISEKYEQMEAKNIEGERQINGILENASISHRQLTEFEKNEINRIRDEMASNTIKTMTQSEIEHKSILERMKADAEKITKEQLAEVVKNSREQKDKSVEAAEETYKKRVAEIIRERDEMGTISKEQADNLIKEAKRQKDETIEKAENMHKKVIDEAKKQAQEHAKEIDWESGEVKGTFRLMCEDVAENLNKVKKNTINEWQEISTTVPQKVEDMKTSIKNKFDEIHDKISDIGKRIKEKLKDMFIFEIPEIPLPHFNIEGSFSLNPPSIPHFGVDWYDKGGIFDRPSVIGVSEKRPEFVGALDDLRYLIRDELDKKILTNKQQQEIYITNITTLDGKEIARETVHYTDEELGKLNKSRQLAHGRG